MSILTMPPCGNALVSISSSTPGNGSEDLALSDKRWTMDELLAELERYEEALQAANMTPETIQSYIDRAHRFVGWLDGDYKPQPHTDRAQYRYPEHRRPEP